MLKLLVSFIALALIAGAIARLFIPPEQRPPRTQWRPLFNKLAILLLLLSLGGLLVHWFVV